MNRSIAINAVKNYNSQNYTVEVPCPQCGAPVIIEETDHILTCQYCRTRVALACEDYCRYCIPPRDPKPESLFYIPFWRLRGLYYFINNLEIRKKFVDANILSCPTPHMPYSLGVRCQTLTLHPIHPKMKGTFIRPQMTKQKSLEKIEEMINVSKGIQNNLDEISESPPQILPPWALLKKRELPLDIFKVELNNLSLKLSKEDHNVEIMQKENFENEKPMIDSDGLTEFIGETISMIYFPIYIKKDNLYDGVLHTPFSNHPIKENDLKSFKQDTMNWKLDLIPLNCPECGWELPAHRDSILFPCKYCSNSWLLYKNQFRKCNMGIVESEKECSIYMPFWKMVVETKGLIEKTYKDQIKRNFRIQSDATEKDRTEATFWSPAFKLVPDIFIQTARNVSTHNPKLKYKQDISENRLFPVTLPATEALESVRLIIALMAESKENVFPLLSTLQIHPKQAMIVYLPFTMRGVELIQEDMHFSFFHSAIRDRTRVTDIL